MPVEAIPFLIAAAAFFSAFILGVGGAALWSMLEPKSDPDDA